MTKFTNEDGEVRALKKSDMAHFKPAKETDPDLVKEMRRLRGQRGAQKAPLKKPVTLRLDPDIMAWFKAQGQGYQTRINDALRDYIDTH